MEQLHFVDDKRIKNTDDKTEEFVSLEPQVLFTKEKSYYRVPMNRTVYIYGLSEDYRILCYEHIIRYDLSIFELSRIVNRLRESYNGINHLFIIDNHYDLFTAFTELKKNPSTENKAIFKTILDKHGLELK